VGKLWRRTTAGQDRYADRRAPNPRAVALRGAIVVVTLTLTAVISTSLALDGNWEVAITAALTATAAALQLGLEVHNHRYAIWRAAGIYGADWRNLSAEDRRDRWQRYCEQWSSQQFAQSNPPASESIRAT
jgi:hypothetical protein